MPKRIPITWRDLARRQDGLLARSQLHRLGLGADLIDTQVAAERWQLITSTVLCTTTGTLTRRQLMWAGVLHAGPDSAVGGLTALEVHGLRNWHRDDVTILLAKSHNLEPLAGVQFVETRRPLQRFRAAGPLPLWQVEPAALLFAAYEPVTRTAYGLLSAVVQQRLTDPASLARCIGQMRPLRRAKPFRRLLDDIAGGVQSLAERDVNRMCDAHGIARPLRQVRRQDASGRYRYTDAEWRTRDGRTVILEVDGGFHMEVEHWQDDISRERALVGGDRLVLRCTSLELRDDPSGVARDLRRLGVGESSA